MTVSGGDSGENAQSDADRPWAEPGSPQPGWGTPPHPPRSYPPGFDTPSTPPGYPPPHPPTSGFDAAPVSPPESPRAYPPLGPAPGYPPLGPPPGYPPSGYGPPIAYPQFGYGAPYSGGYQQPRPGTNKLAIASLVVSIIGVLGWVLSIIGIALGWVAINQVKKTGEDGYGVAVAGIVTGVITLMIGLILTISAAQ